MHSSHFDQFTRQVVVQSRRDILRAMLVAVAVRVITPAQNALAQLDGVVALGGSCARDEECHQADAATFNAIVTCGDNGFSSTDELTCCVGESACCSSDADCCGPLRCASGGEICGLCMPPPFPTRGDKQICISHAQCMFNYSCGPTACINQRCTCLKPNDVSESVDHASDLELPDSDSAMMVAESLSRLEVAGDQRSLVTLFEAMHPDAQEVIPQEAVVGWFENDFQYTGEPPADAIKVRFVPWTWEVTGKMYPKTAVVAVHHYHSNGTVQRELVHLVKDQYGSWGWFFGRSRGFVAEQIARFSPSEGPPLS